MVKLKLPSQAPPGEGYTPPPPKAGTRVAQVELDTNQLQDLADVIGDLKKAAAGHDLRFILRIEVGGTDAAAPESVVDKLNELLKTVSDQMKL